MSFLLGIVWHSADRKSVRDDPRSSLELTLHLAQDPAAFEQFQRFIRSLRDVSVQSDPIYREIAFQRIGLIGDELAQVAAKNFIFTGTETWRIVYEQLLRSPGLHFYRSISWAKNRNYWMDEPGRKSMQVNYELHGAGRLNIERIVILADELWPTKEPLPVETIRQWIHEQHHHGIWIKLVRQSAIAAEQDLIADIGIYGSRALGIQELDDDCRTVRFTLTFNYDDVMAAEKRWARLNVYAAAYADLLNQFWVPE